MNIEIINFGYDNTPLRAHGNDAGADVYANEDIQIPTWQTRKIKLGFGLKIPDGYMALVMPRSGLASEGVVSHVPPVDSGYRGEIHAIVENSSYTTKNIKKGDRIAQIVVMPIIIANFVEDKGEHRGEFGFGSTGLR